MDERSSNSELLKDRLLHDVRSRLQRYRSERFWVMRTPGILLGLGFGGFIDGIVFYVRDDVSDPVPWDLGVLVFGLLLIGFGVARAGRLRS